MSSYLRCYEIPWERLINENFVMHISMVSYVNYDPIPIDG